jgi:hypothetical protein
MTDLSTPMSKLAGIGTLGRYAFEASSNASNTAPTQKKYRATGISGQLHPRERASQSLNR